MCVSSNSLSCKVLRGWGPARPAATWACTEYRGRALGADSHVPGHSCPRPGLLFSQP